MQEPLKQQTVRQLLQINSKYIKYGIIYLLIVLVITTTLIGFAVNNVLSYSDIYSGVYIGDIHVGGYTKESAISAVLDKYEGELSQKSFVIQSKGKRLNVSCADIGAYYDVNAAADKAYKVGRAGNFFRKMKEIYTAKTKHVFIPLDIKADPIKLENKIKELSVQVDIPVQEYSTRIEGNYLYVKEGTSGELIIIEKAKEKILEALNYGYVDVIELNPEVVQPKQVNVEDLYNEVCKEPVDAKYEVQNYKLQIIPHVVGIHFNKEEAAKIIDENRGSGQEYVIPIQLTVPDRTTEILQKILFKDQLAQYTTVFNLEDVDRTTNIKLAAKKINDIVLGPGDVFSYNDVVGSRTKEAGFQNAKVYVGGTVVDGLGGGICQVSSTLYNAILYADLEVVSRTNHSLTVSYVPLGQDATVSYGSIDFKFRNNTEWPIKIISKVSGNRLSLELYGVNNEKGKTVSIENQVIQTTPFSVKYTDDPNLEEGKTIVKQKGGNGYVVDTYKIIKKDGKIVERKKISRSTYLPLEQHVVRGSKKVTVPVSPNTPKDDNSSKQSEQPVSPVETQAPQQSEDVVPNMQGQENSGELPVVSETNPVTQ